MNSDWSPSGNRNKKRRRRRWLERQERKFIDELPTHRYAALRRAVDAKLIGQPGANKIRLKNFKR